MEPGPGDGPWTKIWKSVASTFTNVSRGIAKGLTNVEVKSSNSAAG